MPESFPGLSVPAGVSLEFGIVLGSMVVRQLEDTFPVESALCLLLGREVLVALLGKGQKVEGLLGCKA
jgi:hypothetical protein